MPFTIYDLPDSTSSDYARRQEQYDQDLAAGRVTPAGVSEAAAYQATRVRSVDPQPSHLDSMLGLNVQSQVAYFVPVPVTSVVRGFGTMGTPSLGSISQRETYKRRIQDVLRELAPEEALENEPLGQAILAAIDATLEHDAETSYVLGQMGSLTAG